MDFTFVGLPLPTRVIEERPTNSLSPSLALLALLLFHDRLLPSSLLPPHPRLRTTTRGLLEMCALVLLSRLYEMTLGLIVPPNPSTNTSSSHFLQQQSKWPGRPSDGPPPSDPPPYRFSTDSHPPPTELVALICRTRPLRRRYLLAQQTLLTNPHNLTLRQESIPDLTREEGCRLRLLSRTLLPVPFCEPGRWDGLMEFRSAADPNGWFEQALKSILLTATRVTLVMLPFVWRWKCVPNMVSLLWS